MLPMRVATSGPALTVKGPSMVALFRPNIPETPMATVRRVPALRKYMSEQEPPDQLARSNLHSG